MNIGSMKESSLHAALKEWYLLPGDLIEYPVEGYIVDILRGNEIIEIQTGSFSNIRNKLANLLSHYQITVVYPLPIERYIMRIDNNSGKKISLRKSPKKTRVEEIFKELVYFIPILKLGNISIEILSVKDRIEYINDGKGSWRRRGWSVLDRKLLEIVSKETITEPSGLVKFLPGNLPTTFSTRDIVNSSKLSPNLARKMVYCLFQLRILERVGKVGNSWLYERT